MRCLTLAKALKGQGVSCRFICREHVGNLIDLIRQRGFDVQALPMQNSSQQVSVDEPTLAHSAWLAADWQTDAEQTKMALADEIFDWMVVDHYALDARWERQLKSSYRQLMVIDDIANRPHECDLLLDQNLGREAQDYADLVPKDCQLLVGPKYALLRPEFSEIRQYSLARRSNPNFKHLLISMGGVDKDNATGQVLAALKDCSLPADLRITIVMGLHAPWLAKVRYQAKELSIPTKVLVGVDNMAQLMAECDLAIGAAGSTCWERCCLGLPTLLIVLANNQLEGAKALVKAGSALLVGAVEDISTSLFQSVKRIQDQGLMSNMQNACADVSDGRGTSYIVDHFNVKVWT
jgi:UDP-2,4-diacetamido-2,4,6-trideoxy-beta-L-altropyranose hydrolase